VRLALILPKDSNEYIQYKKMQYYKFMRKIKFEQIGKNFYDMTKAQEIQNLFVVPGFFASLNFYESGHLLCIDTTSRVCRKDNLLAHLKQLFDKGKNNEQINEDVAGSSVTTTHCKSGRHIYRIE
jgi:hypothetical protein